MRPDPRNDRAPELAEGSSALPTDNGALPRRPSARMRLADHDDRPFLVEMARLASVIEDRPLRAPTAPEVTAMLPGPGDCAIIAVDAAGRPIGAAWWSFRQPPLVTDRAGHPVPEMTIAVTKTWRGRGVGAVLIEALAGEAAPRFGAICRNVHIRNPARLCSRTGFQVAGKGRGPPRGGHAASARGERSAPITGVDQAVLGGRASGVGRPTPGSRWSIDRRARHARSGRALVRRCLARPRHPAQVLGGLRGLRALSTDEVTHRSGLLIFALVYEFFRLGQSGPPAGPAR